MADYFKTTLRTRPYSNLGIDYTNTITKGLLSAVPFLERGGRSVLDSVSQNNYYIDHGAAGVYDGDGFTTPVNVTDAKISLGSLLDGVVKDQLTAAALIRVNVTPGTNRSFFGCGNPLATFAYTCYSKSTGEFGFSINSSSSGIAYSTYKPYSGEICLVVLRYDGANLSGWVNGVQVLPDTARTGDVNNLTQSVTIGYTGSTSIKTASATHMFHAIWNRALTEGEIRRLSDNPWQLFQSIPLLLNTSTGSGTTSISSDLALKWDQRQYVSSDLALKWDQLNAVSSDLSLLFDLRQSVASDLALKFDLRQYVSSDLAMLWDLASTLSSVSSDLSMLYDIFSYTSSDLRLRWDQLNTIQSDLSLRFDIFNQVMSDLNLRYDIYQTVTGDLRVVFDLRTATQSDLAILYDMAGTVFSDCTLRWDLGETSGRITIIGSSFKRIIG